MDPQAIFQQIRQLKLTKDDLKMKKFTATSGVVSVTVNGELRILDIMMPKKADEVVLKALKSALNSAIKKAQKSSLAAVQKLAEV